MSRHAILLEAHRLILTGERTFICYALVQACENVEGDPDARDDLIKEIEAGLQLPGKTRIDAVDQYMSIVRQEHGITYGSSLWARNRLVRLTWLERLIEQVDCHDGIHSWAYTSARLPPNHRCTHCGEQYGDPS